jgi:hypothetical protein
MNRRGWSRAPELAGWWNRRHEDGPRLVEQIECDGLLIDTFRKDIGKGLLDYYALEQLSHFVDDLHAVGKEAWLAGSISHPELPAIWNIGVEVVCVRGALLALLARAPVAFASSTNASFLNSLPPCPYRSSSSDVCLSYFLAKCSLLSETRS